MSRPTWCWPRLITPGVACVIGFALASCSSSPQEMTNVSYTCTSPPADLAACSVDADCTTVAIGCYCGAQPINGVARKYAVTASGCEETAAGTCALGCATRAQLVAQDGTMANLGTTLGARCDRSGATAVCKSFVPAAGSGSGGDPGSGGW